MLHGGWDNLKFSKDCHTQELNNFSDSILSVIWNLKIGGYPSKENVFGQSTLLMNTICIAFA